MWDPPLYYTLIFNSFFSLSESGRKEVQILFLFHFVLYLFWKSMLTRESHQTQKSTKQPSNHFRQSQQQNLVCPTAKPAAMSHDRCHPRTPPSSLPPCCLLIFGLWRHPFWFLFILHNAILFWAREYMHLFFVNACTSSPGRGGFIYHKSGFAWYWTDSVNES